MGKYLVATIKSWNIKNYDKLVQKYQDDEFELISDKDEFLVDRIERFDPDYIFFPHWSWIIPSIVYDNYNCVVFHMTDLPFGRGGSPLQNLIVRGIYETKVTAIRVSGGIDTGDVYFKEKLDISTGSADEILKRVSNVVFDRMIPRFIEEQLDPVQQIGEVVEFRRRTPEQSEIPDGLTQRQIYDYIRMLDGEGYLSAFRQYGTDRVYFSNAQFDGKTVTAKAEFVKGEE